MDDILELPKMFLKKLYLAHKGLWLRFVCKWIQHDDENRYTFVNENKDVLKTEIDELSLKRLQEVKVLNDKND